MKKVTLLKALSVTVALLSLAEWTYLGFTTPVVKTIHANFEVDPEEFDWPYPYVMSFHWAWCIPVGIVLAIAIIAKDRWCSRRAAVIANLAVFLAGIALAVAWRWGTVPHRMIQRVAGQNQAAPPNRRPRVAFATALRFNCRFCAPPSLAAAVGEPRR